MVSSIGKELLQDLGKAYHDELHIERTLTTPQHYAYLKISEGCDRKMFLLCHPYYYGPTCVASYGRNPGRGEVSCGPRSEKSFRLLRRN